MKENLAGTHHHLLWRLIVPLSALFLLSETSHAQTQPVTSTSPTPAPTTTTAPKRTPRPEDEILNQMRAARNDPQQSVELIVRLVKEFPDSMGAESAGYSFASAIKKQVKLDTDLNKLRSLARRYIEAMGSSPGPLRVRTNSSAINAMLDNNLAAEAVDLARQTIAVLDEKDFVAARRKAHERDIEVIRKSNPNYKARAFNEIEFVEMFRSSKASYYALFGRGLVKLNELAQAEEAYKQALAVEPNAIAASGIATILEKRGKDKEALDYMARALLTGKLDRQGIERFYELYRKTHGGKLDGAEEYLDRRYKEGYRNPIISKKYKPTATQTGRAVLAEFFTGAGCIPCIPFDYSFETFLEDYPRNDLVLLVYHWHAPTMDPLGNRSSDARVNYYDVHGAPTIFLDGKRFVTEYDDSRSKSEAATTAARVYAELESQINADLKTPPQGQIKLDAKRADQSVVVRLTAGPVRNASPDLSLQIALIENEVHYSGENGLRVHLMVVRDLARQAGSENYGFKIEPSQAKDFNYVFNLKDIITRNLLYYSEYPEERRKEFAERVGAETAKDIGLDFSFKQERNIIDPDNLSVVAFLQDNKTKEILQSTFTHAAESDGRSAPTSK